MLSTNVGVFLGYNYSEIKYNDELDFVIFQEDLFKLGGISETFDFEARFMDRFSTEFIVDAQFLGGIDDNSALIYGGTIVYAVSALPKFNVYRNTKSGTMVTLAANLSYDQGGQSSPFLILTQVIDNALEILQDALQGKPLTEGDLKDIVEIKVVDSIVLTSHTTVSPQILIAQTVSPPVGLQFAARYDYGIDEQEQLGTEKFETEDPPTAWFLGGMASLDLNKMSSVPMGFRFELGYEQEANDEVNTSTMTFAGGLNYTGRRNLDLGLSLLNNRFTTESDEDSEDAVGVGTTMLVNMRYTF
ncbi:hypothetical protein KDL45_01540 [bacterium]|nr:hypothetical protein [bacterium]